MRIQTFYRFGDTPLSGQSDDESPWLHDRPASGQTKSGRDAMPTGTVKWFNTTKGYGFIAPDDGGQDVFVHISAVERAGLTGLADNQKIDYELISGRDGRESAGELQPL